MPKPSLNIIILHGAESSHFKLSFEAVISRAFTNFEMDYYHIKNAFYVGNYQQCIKEAQKFKTTNPTDVVERDIFLYRSYLGLGKFAVVQGEIGPESHSSHRPLRMLADYLTTPAKREGIVDDLEKEYLTGSGNLDSSNAVALLVAATIFLRENNPEGALRVLHISDHIECIQLRLHTLLSMNRLDLARKELKIMQEKDDDGTLTQLSLAAVNLQMGGDKIQEAYYIYQELIDKFGPTTLLLNGQASSFIQQGKFEEAESALQEALEKDSSCPETFINMIVLSQQTGKSHEVCKRYLTQLKDVAPEHAFVKSYQSKENDFELMVKQYRVAV